MRLQIDERLAQAKSISKQLLESKKYYFSDLKPSDLTAGLAVVYAIFDRDSGEALYVGRTKNLRQGLYSFHLMGAQSSARLKKYLVDDQRVPEITTMTEAKAYLRAHCYFQYIPEERVIQRGQMAGLLSYLLDVRYMYEEH